MCGHANIHLVVLTVAVTITGLQVQSTNIESLPVFENPVSDALKVHRATAYTLLIEVPCRLSCSIVNVRFKIKKSQKSLWRAPPGVRIHPSHNDIYSISGLEPDTLYYIRALLSPLGYSYTPVLEARTCPERPPRVAALAVAGAGPGWLDVRWTPPRREACVSDFEYDTRYRADGGNFTLLRTYGVVPSLEKGYVHIRPSHPCPSWPKQFCLLLVDDVQPGKNHTIEIQVHRLDGRSSERAEIQSIVGFANTLTKPSAFGPLEGSPRGPHNVPGEDSVHTWFIVTIGALMVFVSFTGIALVLLQSGLRRRWGRRSSTATAAAEQSDSRRRSSETLALTGPARRPSLRGSLRLCGRELLWAQPPPRYEDVAHLSPAAPPPRDAPGA